MDRYALLARAHVVHYELVGKVLTRHRLEALYAERRATEGFGIAEVQDACSVLERAIWRRLVAALPRLVTCPGRSRR